MFLNVCCCLDLSASFASYLVRDGEITVILQIFDLENFFLVIDVASRTLFLHRATAKASLVDSLDGT